MNSSSTIEISKSSLISLKAEILRKQQEVNKAKVLQASIQQTQTPLREKSKGNTSTERNEPSNRGIESRQARDDEEDMDLLQKSRKTLEQKEKLYNRLVKGPGNLSNYEIEMNKHYLVQFDRKDNKRQESSEDEQHFSDEYDPPENPDEEWVEYTDCLGRTRKCLRKDLEFLKGKDIELSKNLGGAELNAKEAPPQWVIDTKGDKIIEEANDEPSSSSNITEHNELLSSDMRRELLRKEWEKQEHDLMNKTDIHYQDILFNEARSHGVGYYAFSKDDEVRAKQQAELQKMRKETIDKQKANLDQKAMRDKQLAARLKAARNRKRARMGLPPEEDEPEKPAPVVQEETVDEVEKQKLLEKEALEKAKDEKRRKHIRAWDIGKEGIVPHYEYSQEEWVDKKRSERPKEFAPPSKYNETKHKRKESESEDYSEEKNSLYFTSKKSGSKDGKKKRINPYINNSDSDEPKETSTFGHSSRNMHYYKNDSSNDGTYSSDDHIDDEPASNTFKPSPIIDECIDGVEIPEVVKTPEAKPKRKGAEIAPPATFDYYGPSSTKQPKNKGPITNLEDSIAAGLRFLREKAEFKQRHGGSRSEFDNC